LSRKTTCDNEAQAQRDYSKRRSEFAQTWTHHTVGLLLQCCLWLHKNWYRFCQQWLCTPNLLGPTIESHRNKSH